MPMEPEDTCHYTVNNVFYLYYAVASFSIILAAVSICLIFKFEYQKTKLFVAIISTLAIMILYNILMIVYVAFKLDRSNSNLELDCSEDPEYCYNVGNSSGYEETLCICELLTGTLRLLYIAGISCCRIWNFIQFMEKYRKFFIALAIITLSTIPILIIYMFISAADMDFKNTYFSGQENCEMRYCVAYSIELLLCIPGSITWLLTELFVLVRLRFKNPGSILNLVGSVLYTLLYTLTTIVNIIRDFYPSLYFEKLSKAYIVIESICLAPIWLVMAILPLTLLFTVSYHAPKGLELIMGTEVGRSKFLEYSKTIKSDDVIRGFYGMKDFRNQVNMKFFKTVAEKNKAAIHVYKQYLDQNSPDSMYVEETTLNIIKKHIEESPTTEIPDGIYDKLLYNLNRMIDIDVLPGFYKSVQYAEFNTEMKLTCLNDGVDIIQAIRNWREEKKKNTLKESFDNPKYNNVLIKGVL